MQLHESDIETLKRIHFQERGQKLSDEDAWDLGLRLLNLYQLVDCPNDDSGVTVTHGF